MRRLLENGANTSFVNRIVDETVSIDDLIADPVEESIRLDGQPHPTKIPLPLATFGARAPTRRGMDLQRTTRWACCRRPAGQRPPGLALPLLAAGDIAGAEPQGGAQPGQPHRDGGRGAEATGRRQSALHGRRSRRAAPGRHRLVAENALPDPEARGRRHGIQLATLMGLLVREAGNLPNAIAECARRGLLPLLRPPNASAGNSGPDQPSGAGPVVFRRISPWNFPLAIFSGEGGAALAAWQPVLGRQADRPLIARTPGPCACCTPRRAAATCCNCCRAGGGGRGADRRPARAGVIFTGSTEVAQADSPHPGARAAVEVPLIAETGGQNAMIVDSSALPEQVVADVINSASTAPASAARRAHPCCLREDIADKVGGHAQGRHGPTDRRRPGPWPPTSAR